MIFPEEFEEWLKKIEPDLDHIYGILAVPLPDEPQALIVDLENIECWNARIGYLLAEANSFLDRGAMYYMPTRDPDMRELDRKSLLDDRLSHVREFRDKIETLCDSIKQRLILGESVLSYFKINLESGRQIFIKK